MKTEYDIICADGIGDLIDAVNKKTAKGWEVQGQMIRSEPWSIDGRTYHSYFQTLTREIPDAKPETVEPAKPDLFPAYISWSARMAAMVELRRRADELEDTRIREYIARSNQLRQVADFLDSSMK